MNTNRVSWPDEIKKLHKELLYRRVTLEEFKAEATKHGITNAVPTLPPGCSLIMTNHDTGEQLEYFYP